MSRFAELVATLDYPVFLATTAVGSERSGCLIGFATQCSIHPPRFLACLSRKNHTHGVAMRATVLAVHVVDTKHRHLAELFGGETGDEIDKFAQARWQDVHGVPVLDECERWFTGTILDRIDCGDHTGFLLEPLESGTGGRARQLTYQQTRDIAPGHQP